MIIHDKWNPEFFKQVNNSASSAAICPPDDENPKSIKTARAICARSEAALLESNAATMEEDDNRDRNRVLSHFEPFARLH
mmetsp:Transcript_28654/g.58568  ORF Transcript_28654/g.58568 Transcript_28654/m.58568 type:complete len:80 (+) Transcript_28654:217-456(+)